VYGEHRNPQHLRRLFSGKTGEEPQQLHKPAPAFVDSGQHHERFIEGNDIRAAASSAAASETRTASPPRLCRRRLKRLVHQDASHHFRRNSEEISTVLPSHSVSFSQAEEHFIHQSCGCKVWPDGSLFK